MKYKVPFTEYKEKSMKTPGCIWHKYISFPIALRISYLFYSYSNISANLVTVLSFLTGLCAALFFFLGGQSNYIIGAVIYFFAYVLDCVDGQLARARADLTRYGAWLDLTLDRTLTIILGFSLSFSWYRDTGQYSILIYMYIFVSFFLLNLVRNVLIAGEEPEGKAQPSLNDGGVFTKAKNIIQSKLSKIGLNITFIGLTEMMMLVFFFGPLFYIVDKILPAACVWVIVHNLIFTFIIPVRKAKMERKNNECVKDAAK